MSRRSVMLLEVLVGLALLAGLGVWLLRLETEAVRQYHESQNRDQVAAKVEQYYRKIDIDKAGRRRFVWHRTRQRVRGRRSGQRGHDGGSGHRRGNAGGRGDRPFSGCLGVCPRVRFLDRLGRRFSGSRTERELCRTREK